MISFICCLGGLLYQVTILFLAFISGNTVNNIIVTPLCHQPLPAITVCFPFGYSLKELANFDPTFAEMFRKYQEYGENIQNKVDQAQLREEINKHLADMQLVFKPLEFIQNYSIPPGSVEITVVGTGPDNEDLDPISPHKTHFKYRGKPIESLAYHQGKPAKCLTYFSTLQQPWRDYIMVLEGLQFTVTLQDHWPGNDTNIYLRLHGPNTLLDYVPYQGYSPLQVRKHYAVFFSRMISKLLGTGYNTDCFDYDLDYKYANNNIHSDCLTACKKSKMLEYQGCLNVGEPKGSLLRKELFQFEEPANHSVCEDNPSFQLSSHLKAKSNCYLECRIDCEVTEFFCKYEELEQLPQEDGNKIILDIQLSGQPDILNIVSPETSFISFISNFGGLLGMWLGFSLLSISEDLIRILLALIKDRSKRSAILKLTQVFNFNFTLSKPQQRAKSLSNHSIKE